ncbi:MAG: hypothetical protein JRI23_07635 [Deltaproteobacteria bacterium]|jgi:hypothetical protein|nr:hypothetical protein [Deltaproteobacteria bacterium]MBW2531476.1 hypothetical protein [Deltaproteobacteria bacterium]
MNEIHDKTGGKPAAAEPPALRCLRGAIPPPSMGSDLSALLALPEKARTEFWVALRAYLRPELDDEAHQAISDYCAEHGLEPAEIAPAVKATRHLFRECARANISKEELSADVHALAGEDDGHELAALLLPWFEDFLPKLRAALARQTVVDHGKVVVDSHWRLERITSSDRGEWLNTSVGVLTFNYIDGAEQRRVTLHFLPDQIAALRDAATEMLA